MIKNASKRIMGAVLASVLMIYATVPAYAAGSRAEKEEVVYVKLSHDGQVDTIYVVNSFDLPQGGAITDTGAYREIRNLTTTDAIHYTNNTVSITAPQGKFYYEGVLENREIPWDISVQYLLDGKPISGDKLAGKNGQLQIDLHIHQNQKANPVYTDNYAIQASLSLDSERCTNIVAEDATIASVGKSKQMSYIILPGKEGNFTITADVEDFEMDGISINGVPLSLNIDDPDTEEIKDKIAELQDGAVELDDGAWELDDGAQELNEGAVDLDEGATKLDDGVLALEDGVAELEDGVEELRDGANDLRDGAHELYQGTRDFREGVEELEAGMSRLSGGTASFGEGLALLAGQTDTLTGGSSEILQGLQRLESGIDGLREKDFAKMMEQAEQLQAGTQLYQDTLDTLIEAYENQLQDSLSLGMSGNEELLLLQETISTLKGLRENYVQINDGVALLTDTVLAQGESLPALMKGIRELVEQYTIFDGALLIYTRGMGQLRVSYSDVAMGIGSLAGGVNELSEGSKELRSGARELYDGTYDLQDGVNRLTDGAAELRDGAVELRDGTIEMKDGTLELLDGTQELLDGTLELLDGTTELREKTADMDQEIDDRIDELLEEYRGTDFDAISFVDTRNEVSSVQFVMLTDGITIDDLMEDMVDQSEPASLTIWQRFLNLFSFLWK